MTYTYDRTASAPSLDTYIEKLRELTDLLDESPEIDDSNLHKSFVSTVKETKKRFEKERFQAATKVRGVLHNLMDLKKLLEESKEASK